MVNSSLDTGFLPKRVPNTVSFMENISCSLEIQLQTANKLLTFLDLIFCFETAFWFQKRRHVLSQLLTHYLVCVLAVQEFVNVH